MKYDFIKVGATVCWHDPEGISEGEYKVASVPDNLEDDSVVPVSYTHLTLPTSDLV